MEKKDYSIAGTPAKKTATIKTNGLRNSGLILNHDPTTVFAGMKFKV